MDNKVDYEVVESLKSFVECFSSIPSRNYKHNGNKIALKKLKKIIAEYNCKFKIDDFLYEENTFSNIIVSFNNNYHKTYLFCAHFDSISVDNIAPGADDNAAGVGVLLEVIKAVSVLKLRINLEFVFFNLEEEHSIGSIHLANKFKKENVKLEGVINLDAIGTWSSDFSTKNPLSYVTNEESREFMNQVIKFLPLPLVECPDPWYDDHASFWDADYKAIELTEYYPSEYFHTKNDTSEKLHYENLGLIVNGLIELIKNWNKIEENEI